MKRFILAACLLLVTTAAMAQTQPDPRIVGPMLAAMQAELALRDAALKVMKEDKDKLDQWFKEYFGTSDDNKP